MLFRGNEEVSGAGPWHNERPHTAVWANAAFRPWLIFLLLMICSASFSQRTYQSNSVLASGPWYRIAVTQTGIYRMDLAFLNSMGLTGNLSSSSIRLYGNGGAMLAEANNAPRTDDLRENAIMVVDGGDGVINGSDYILFYASGPDQWLKDSANQRFSHQKNLYSDQSYYFLTTGGSGLRVAQTSPPSSPNLVVNSFNGRLFHELDTMNFLASGKEWYGEEFSSIPGRVLTRTFNITAPNIVNGNPAILQSRLLSRSVVTGSAFDIRVNNVLVGQSAIAPVGSGQFDLFGREATQVATIALSQPNVSVGYTYNPGSFNAQGWLNWFELFYRQQLSLNGLQQLAFRDWASVGNNTAEFVIAGSGPTTQVWDVTDPARPVQMAGSLTGTEYRFVNSCSRLREYIAFNNANFLAPMNAGKVNNQDLHNTSPADHFIITHPSLLPQAQRLATFHQQRNGWRVKLVTTDQVYNEFSSGVADPVAIRDYLKMYYDKYGSDPANKPRYLLLFGDASYDFKNRLDNNANLVPAYQNNVSLDVLSTYTSDDFFGFLGDNEDINSTAVSNDLDLGIGRVPAKNIEEAKNFADKVDAYFHPQSFGPWRNNMTFVADDEDQNLHLQDAETITATVAQTDTIIDVEKIYLDAYRQESGPDGSRYPQANQASNNQIYNGTLIWNFTGHGGPKRLAEETIVDQETVNAWNNPNKLPLFITATCDFAPYDNPLQSSLGENILLRPKTGAIALMTTTRIVFAFSNRIMNNNYMQYALQRDTNGKYRTLGDAVRDAKNYTYQTSTDIVNNRKFTLLGDPAMTLAFPRLHAVPVQINGKPVSQIDTLGATEKITIDGEIRDIQGNTMSSFNGNVYPTVFDKIQQVATLANDPGSQVTNFSTRSNILFKGKVTTVNGKFSFSFKVPKDINYQFGNGKISLYAENGNEDARGSYTGFLVGGASANPDNDKVGPEMKPFLNDEKFVNGGLANENPLLIIKLSDSSGINTAGTGIGHDIVATLDNDPQQFFVLNDFYQGELNSYQAGEVRFQMPELPAGPHTLKIKAWDVLNNSSEVMLDFTVANDEKLELSHVLNYPNPFTTRTSFWFEHNKPGQNLVVRLQIFTLSGRVIKMMEKTINTPGNRSSDLEWDGRDEYGDKVGKGIYFYKLSVSAPGKQRKEKIEKLAIF